jgi:hypothetical protein
VGAADARHEPARPRSERGEEAERAVDVQPGVVLGGEVRKLVQRVEQSCVHVAGRGDENRRCAVEAAQRLLERVAVECPGRVRENAHLRATDAEHRERLHRARVHVAARQHRHRRETREAVLLDVDAVLRTPPAPRRREAREVRRRRAGREHAAPVGRQPEQLLQPADRDLL